MKNKICWLLGHDFRKVPHCFRDEGAKTHKYCERCGAINRQGVIIE